MRELKIFSLDSNTIQSTYDPDEMTSALEDITANEYAAIDIKFDFNGDIIIFVTDVLKEKYEEG